MKYLKSINEYSINSYYTELSLQEYQDQTPGWRLSDFVFPGSDDDRGNTSEPFTDLEIKDLSKFSKKMKQNYPAMITLNIRIGFLFLSYATIYIRKGLDEWFYVCLEPQMISGRNVKSRYFKCDQFSAVKELLNNIKGNKI